MNVIAIELGFGTSSYATRLNSAGKPDVKTFVSVVAQVDPKVDLSSGMGTRNTVQITKTVGGSIYLFLYLNLCAFVFFYLYTEQ